MKIFIKNIKYILLLLFSFFLLATVDSNAQIHINYMDSLKTKDFDKIVKLTEDYYSDKDKGKGSGYKQFKRWESLNKIRLDKNRELTNFAEINQTERSKALNRSQPNESDWMPIAAPKYEKSSNTFNSYNGGLGRVNCIAIDPNDSDIIYIGTPASGVWKTTTGGANWNSPGAVSAWTPLMENLCVGVSGIVIDPDNTQIVYALTGDGNGRDTYSMGVYKSVNGGMSWSPTNLAWDIGDGIFGYKLARHSSGTLYAATTRGIYKSNSDGTWQINSLPIKTDIDNEPFYDIEFHPTASHIIYASTSKKIYRSTSTGSTWNVVPVTTSNSFNSRIEIAVASSTTQPSYVYAVYGDYAGIVGKFNGLYLSEDHGATFQLKSDEPSILSGHPSITTGQNWYNLAIVVNPNDAEEVHVGGINTWRSTNKGVDWEMTGYWYDVLSGKNGVYCHADVHSMIFNNNTLYCGNDGGIYKSEMSSSNTTESGVLSPPYIFSNIQWENISYGLQISQVYNIGTNKNPEVGGVSYAAQDNGLNLAVFDTNNGNYSNWVHWFGGDGIETIFDPFNNDILYGSQQRNSIYRYNTSTKIATNITPIGVSSFADFEGSYDVCNDDGSLTMAYASIYRYNSPSTDAATNWIHLDSDGEIPLITNWTDGVFTSLSVAPSNSDVIYVSRSLGSISKSMVYFTYNGGQDWDSFDFDNSKNRENAAEHIIFHPTDPNIVWITFPGSYSENFGRVYKTIDGGQNWQDISNNNGLPQVAVNTIVYQNGSYDNGSINRLYVGTDCGVYYIEDGFSNWVSYNDNLPAIIVNDLEINYCTDMIYAGTFGRGVWQSPLQTSSFSSDLTLIDDHTDSNIFISNSYVESDIGVDSEVNVVYQGSSYVCLRPGFIAMPNDEGYFCGQIIDPCSVTVPFTANRVIGHIAQNMDGVQLENIGGNRLFEEVMSNSNLKILGNPSPRQASVSFDLDTQSAVSLYIYDQQGKFLKQILDNVSLDVGNHQYNLQMTDHQKGVYFIALSYGGKKSIRKLVKL